MKTVFGAGTLVLIVLLVLAGTWVYFRLHPFKRHKFRLFKRQFPSSEESAPDYKVYAYPSVPSASRYLLYLHLAYQPDGVYVMQLRVVQRLENGAYVQGDPKVAMWIHNEGIEEVLTSGISPTLREMLFDMADKSRWKPETYASSATCIEYYGNGQFSEVHHLDKTTLRKLGPNMQAPRSDL